MLRPLVSVLIDTFNHERFIETAINSVLEQDFSRVDREVVVVDDGSSDRTREILRKFEPGIRVLSKPNGGQASAFNYGIAECRGEIIAFLDGDDWWLPGKLARVVKIMCDEPLLGAIGHGFVEVSEDSWHKTVSCSAECRFRLDSKGSAEFFRVHRCYLGTSRLTLRADIARRCLPVPESLVFEADEYLFTLAPLIADTLILPDVLTSYRMHGANLFLAAGGTPSGGRKKLGVLTALARELNGVLSKWSVAPEVRRTILEIVELESRQLRLSFDGGYPWETFQTETSLYRIHHADASLRSKAFRGISMVPALLLPPRWFYGARRWLGSQSWYNRARQNLIPFPQLITSDPATSGRKTDELAPKSSPNSV